LTRHNRTEHDILVQRACNTLIQSSYIGLKADLPNYDQPDRIFWTRNNEGHVPDITASKGGVLCLFEAETPDTIDIEHTESQLILFDAYARQNKGRAYLVVPKSSEGQAKNCIVRLKLNHTFAWAI